MVGSCQWNHGFTWGILTVETSRSIHQVNLYPRALHSWVLSLGSSFTLLPRCRRFCGKESSPCPYHPSVWHGVALRDWILYERLLRKEQMSMSGQVFGNCSKSSWDRRRQDASKGTVTLLQPSSYSSSQEGHQVGWRKETDTPWSMPKGKTVSSTSILIFVEAYKIRKSEYWPSTIILLAFSWNLMVIYLSSLLQHMKYK